MSDWKAKRFWKTVEISALDDGFSVLLDHKPIKTPLKNDLRIPTKMLAETVAKEWDDQKDVILPQTMPATRIVNTAIDRVRTQRAEVIGQLLDYIPTDTLCFVTPVDRTLRKQQEKIWTLYIDWGQQYLKHPIHQTETFSPPQQLYKDTVKDVLTATTDVQLTCLYDCITLTGSILLGLATFEKAFGFKEIWNASVLEETSQHEQWGADAEALEALERKKHDFLTAAHILHMVK
jgi:chaperone required for assembly of F1-ATPase